MSHKEVEQFAKNVQLALRLHSAGRPGLLSQADFRQLRHLISNDDGWSLYKNSLGVTHLGSPNGDHIKIDPEGGMAVYGPKKQKELKPIL